MDKINTRKLLPVAGVSHIVELAEAHKALYCKRWGVKPASFFLTIRTETILQVMKEGLFLYDKKALKRKTILERLFGRRGR